MNTTASVQIHYQPRDWEPEFTVLETGGAPFVSLRLGPGVSMLSRSPGDLLKLAATLGNAARDLANAPAVTP